MRVRFLLAFVLLSIASASFNAAAAQSGAPIYQINCGGGSASPYATDQLSNGGSAASVSNAIDTSGVSTPAPQAVYQSCRYGSFGYALPGLTPGGTYTVRLHFSENYWTVAGGRIFNVAINGSPVLTNFDVFAAAGGQFKAVVKAFAATADSSGQIAVQLSPSTTSQDQNPIINGIEVFQGLSAPDAPSGVTALTSSGQVILTWNGVGTASSYHVKRATVRSGIYTTVASPSGTSFTDVGLANGTTYYYAVSAVNASGEGSNSARVAATPSASVLNYVYRIDCGGGAAPPFVADQFSNGGSAASVSNGIDTGGAGSPAPQAVYQSCRYGSFGYALPNLTPGGTYTVRLHFSENYWTVSGGRNFSVSINGQPVLTNFDAFAAAGGQFKAVVRTSTAVADATGQITVQFSPGTTGQDQTPIVNGIELVAGVIVPGQPTGLTAVPGDGQVQLAWLGSDSATNYAVKRSTASGGPYATISAPGSVTGSSFIDTGVTDGTAYYYVVSAVNAGGESADSAEASATPVGPVRTYVYRIDCGGGAVSPFAADQFSSGGSAASVTNAIDTGGARSPAPQAVYQSCRFGNFTYNLPNLTPGAEYVVRLHFSENYWTVVGGRNFSVAINGTQVLTNFDILAETASQYKALIKTFTAVADATGQITVQFSPGTTGQDQTPVLNGLELSQKGAGVPNSLTATVANGQLTLNWGAVAGAIRYNVKRYTASGGPYTLLATPAGTAYTDASAVIGTAYYFVVSAVAASGESDDSNEATATVLLPPTAPQSLTATPGNGQVLLGWSGDASATGYNVKRALAAGGPFVTVGAGVAGPSYADSTVTNGTAYLYTVSALSVNGESADADQVMAMPTGPAAPFSSASGYGYNGDGLRAWKQTASGKRYFLYDGEKPVCELDAAGNVIASNTWGATGLVARREGGASTFYAFDERGNAAQRLDDSGGILGTYLFDAFGDRTGTDGSDDPYAGFGGQWGYYTDAETGLILCTHRYYDPAQGRFLTRDPIGYDGGVNLYGYTANNPISRVDPNGHFFQIIIAVVVLFFAVESVADTPSAGFTHKSLPEEFSDYLDQLSGPGGAECGDAPCVSTAGITRPTLGGPVIYRRGPVTISQNYANYPDAALPGTPAEHGPPHVHIEGGGRPTRVGVNGSPIFAGDPNPTAQQQRAIDDSLPAIRKACRKASKLIRYFKEVPE